MKMISRSLAVAIAGSLALDVHARQPVNDGKGISCKLIEMPMAEANFGRVTLGGKSSEDLQSGYGDFIGGGFVGPNSALFVNLRGTFDDNDQQVFSAGIGFRHLIEGPGIIIGANAYYDHLETAYGNSLRQFGFGAEILTKWVDARFNYYLPQDDSLLVRKFTDVSRDRSTGPETATIDPQPIVTSSPRAFSGGFRPLFQESFRHRFQRNLRTTTTATTFGIFEEGLEGWNAEAGVLVPGLNRYFDLRIFAGGYNYQDPAGGDIAGFRARAEARVTSGVTLDLEYWEDEELVGGNWVGGVRVSLPFDLGNLLTGRNPFEGAEDTFRRAPSQEMRARMDEMVIRSHRIQTGLTGVRPLGTTTTMEDRSVTTGEKILPSSKSPPSGRGGNQGGGTGSGSGAGFSLGF